VEGLLDYAISPAGPADAADLAAVHVRSWRETYRGLLPQAALERMSVRAHARRFQHELTQRVAARNDPCSNSTTGKE